MEEWIQHVLNSDQAGYTVLIAVFLFGFISLFTCGCNYSIIAMVAGYSGNIGSSLKTKSLVFNGLLFMVGMIISMVILGGIIGYASELISISFGKYWKIAAGFISIFFGLYAMDLLPFKVPGISFKPSPQRKGTFSSIVFGLTVGGLLLASSSCCNPVFPIVLAVSFVKGSFFWGMLLMFAYALGNALIFFTIILGIGLGFETATSTFKKLGNVLKYAGGIIMITVGFYLLITV